MRRYPRAATLSSMANPQTPSSPRLLAAAPHRLMFFIGASNLLLAMAWWAAWMISARWPALAIAQPQLPAGWLHALVMQYQMLPSFIFGFLLHQFPERLGFRG